jgi:hypothetical protein
MTSKAPIIVVSMMLLAGCAQVSPYARSETEDPPFLSRPTYSTAVANDQPERVVVKTVSPRDSRMMKPLAADLIAPLNVRERDETKKATSEIAVEASPPNVQQNVPVEKNADFQVPTAPVSVQQEPLTELEPVVRALHYIFVGKQQEAIKSLRPYDEATQEFMLRVLPLLTHIAKKSLAEMPSQDLVILNEMIRGLGEQLRTRCELTVSKMVYCKSINGFANYEALPDNHAFLARTDKRPGDRVQLYIELKNFASKETKEGDFLTKLSCSLELKDAHGEKVWAHTFDKNETTHRRSSCVNDYHGNFSFYVPALPAGTYQLTIQVVDETIPDHRRLARSSQVFRVTPVSNSASWR